MCGIAGVIGYRKELLEASLAKMRHRGPDCLDVWSDEKSGVHLGHVRLSIIDLDNRSNQPFLSDCGRYAIVFNGEIYNYALLRDRLRDVKASFRTESDTEVLLYWLINYGVEGLLDVDGMFAFGFFDRLSGNLLLARDPIGEKPLYYSCSKFQGKNCFSFGSEIKALRDFPGVDLGVNEEALLDYLRFLYTAAPNTLYKGIVELEPGGYVFLNANNPTDLNPRRYYDLEKRIRFDDEVEFSDAIESFGQLFTQSVGDRLVSDVDVGFFLSAGLDSNAILEASSRFSGFKRGRTYTLEYKDGYSEGSLARRISESKGLKNESILFSELDFDSSRVRMVNLFDQPFGNSTAVVSEMIAQTASRSCRVCLVGDGGDEVLVGYPRYKAVNLMGTVRRIPSPIRSASAFVSSYLPERGPLAVPNRRLKQFLGKTNRPLGEAFLDWSTYVDTSTLKKAFGRADVETGFYKSLMTLFDRHSEDPVRAATLVDMKSFVPYNLLQSADRTSMAHSLELRTPFLAPKLVERCLGMHSNVRLVRGKTKPLLTSYFQESIPKYILKQPKRPFNPPIRVLLYREMARLEALLLGKGAAIGDYLSKEFVASEVCAFKSGKRDNSTFLWGLASLETWLQQR